MKNNETKTTKNASLGFTGGVTTEENKRKAKTIVTQTKKGSDDDIREEKAVECGQYFKALQKKDINEQGSNARVYNALLDGIIIRYAKDYKTDDKMYINVSGLSAIAFSLGRLRRTNILTTINVDIQDTDLTCIHYTLDITAINPYKLKEISDTYKLNIDVEFPEDYDNIEPSFEW